MATRGGAFPWKRDEFTQLHTLGPETGAFAPRPVVSPPDPAHGKLVRDAVILAAPMRAG
jgi:hypothetical protein